MSNFIPTIILFVAVIAFLLFSLSQGYRIRTRSKRAAIALATAGSVTGVVLAVDYFVEVPGIIFGASLAVFVGSFLFAAFEVARKDAMQSPS
jgi:hypothetical protein